MFQCFRPLSGALQRNHIADVCVPSRLSALSTSLQNTVDQARDLCESYRVGRFQDATKARHLLNTVMRNYRKQPAAVNAAVDLLQHLAPADPAIFNPVLNCWKNLMLSNKRHIRRSLTSLDAVLEKLGMILPGDSITTGIFVQVILDQKSIAEAEAFMESQGSKEFNSHLYNQILKARVDRRDPPSQIEAVLGTMHDRGVPKDNYTYSILMHYWKDDAKQVKAILNAADEGVVDVTCWSQWVQYETRRHHVVMEDVEKVILDRILGKDPHQLGLSARDVLDAYSRRFATWPNTVERAEVFLHKVRNHVSPALEGSLLRVMMGIYMKAGSHAKAVETFDEIEQPTAAAYMTLIRNYHTQKQPGKAANTLYSVLMESSYRVAPTVAMFNLVLETYLLTDEPLDKALLVWKWMQHSAKCQILGIQPDLSTFALLMRLCIHHGVSAKNFLAEMNNLQPTCTIYMLALESLLLSPEILDFPTAERILQQLGQTNTVKFGTIVRSYPSTTTAAQDAINAFESHTSNVSENSFNIVLAILAKTFRHDSAAGDMAWAFYQKHRERFGVNSTSLSLLAEAGGTSRAFNRTVLRRKGKRNTGMGRNASMSTSSLSPT